jgi:adenine phosphoribosyltransferase/phosphomevalonate kinase
VITGSWYRAQDDTESAQSAIGWVYQVAEDLLSSKGGAVGVYGADFGADPRDATLASKAFGPNRLRLSHLKQRLDPQNILAYACPLTKPPMEQKLVVLVTGDHGVGKDYCADVWTSVFKDRGYTARLVSISEVTKREYAAANNINLDRLFSDRAYKEQHRSALTEFFKRQMEQNPEILKEHFQKVVDSAEDVDVLIITGMRDEAPVATYSHLVPRKRVAEVNVRAHEQTVRIRREGYGDDRKSSGSLEGRFGDRNLTATDSHPSFIFENERNGSGIAKRFAELSLVPLVNDDMQQLANMVRTVPDFPHSEVDFRHVLDITQQPDGLRISTSMLQTHFAGSWNKVDAVVCCEVGSYVFASALAARENKRLVLVREAGKLPPPTYSVSKEPSHISGLTAGMSKEMRIEMERHSISSAASVVVVDDVLATGETLCAVLALLGQAGIKKEHMSVTTVAEFPSHRGRQLLRRRGFGKVQIQSLLVFGGS